MSSLATALLIKQRITKKTNPTALKQNKNTTTLHSTKNRSKKADSDIGQTDNYLFTIYLHQQ